MFYVYPILFSAFMVGCFSQEFINNLDNENLIDEVDEDNEYIAKTTSDEKQNINDIIQRGFEVTDVIRHELIDADLVTMKYTLKDTKILGINNCKVLKTEVNEEITSMKIDMRCPNIKLDGSYTTTGFLITIPIEGNGDYSLNAEDYLVSITARIKKFKGKDDKTHVKFQTYSLNAEVLGRVTYYLSNLFNGDQKLSDAVHKFMNENWKAVAHFGQYPIWYPTVKIMLKNANMFLKPVPLESLNFNDV